ncbi:MAG: hypothetical protein AB8G14_00230 [Ilumatobacter sp.]
MTTSLSSIRSWFSGRLPADWAAVEPVITIDRDEITIAVTVDAPPVAEDASDADRSEAIDGAVSRFREDTRERRMKIAREAEHRFDRKVAWAIVIDGQTVLFTHLAAPVMTRLRQPERMVLDTLIDASIARSRAEAVAWCVRLVGSNADEWLAELRDALRGVDDVRNAGPNPDSPA